MVFTAVRRIGEEAVLVAVSLSERPEEAEVTFGGGVTEPGELELRDPFRAGGNVVVKKAGGRHRLPLQPFQVLVSRL